MHFTFKANPLTGREKKLRKTLYLHMCISLLTISNSLCLLLPHSFYSSRAKNVTLSRIAKLRAWHACAYARIRESRRTYGRACVRACLLACVRAYVCVCVSVSGGGTKKKSVYYNIRWSCRLYILLVLLSLTVSHRNDILLPRSLLLVLLVMSLSLPLLPLSYCVRRGMNFIIGARATLRRHS